MRQFTKTYYKAPTREAFRKLTKANESNAAKAAIAVHRAKGFKEALSWEKKKRRRGKKLNLLGDVHGKAQFFGSEEVRRAIIREDEKLAAIEQEKLDKAKAKEDKAVAKAVKEALEAQEKIRKAEQKEINAQVKAEAKKQGVLDRAVARKAAIATKKAAKNAKPSRIVIFKVGSTFLGSLGSHEVVVVESLETEGVGGVSPTKSGRRIILPQRFRK